VEQFPATLYHRRTLEVLGDQPDGEQAATDEERAFGDFLKAYGSPLQQYVAGRLSGARGKRLDLAEEFVQGFLADQVRRKREGRKTIFSTWDGQRSFRVLLQESCWNYVQQVRPKRRGTVTRFEPFRASLEDHVRRQLQRPGVPGYLPDLVADYVREFVEYYASRHARPPSIDVLKAKCWDYVEWWLLRPDLPAWD